jgi:hypothetical protein
MRSRVVRGTTERDDQTAQASTAPVAVVCGQGVQGGSIHPWLQVGYNS